MRQTKLVKQAILYLFHLLSIGSGFGKFNFGRGETRAEFAQGCAAALFVEVGHGRTNYAFGLSS